MAIIRPSPNGPWLVGLFMLVLIWCVWYIGIPSESLSDLTNSAALAYSATFDTASEVESEGGPVSPILSESKQEEEHWEAAVAGGDSSPAIPPSQRPLILYAYSESETARANIEFFIKHGLHGEADFIFIFNGETDVLGLIPQKQNIRYVQRPNDCYDLGAYAEVLTHDGLYKAYQKFIMLNASIRGPFVPYWSEGCWSERYLSKITDEVKLVGMTGNCWPSFHIQSMIWATDITGLSILLYPSEHINKSQHLADDDNDEDGDPRIELAAATERQASRDVAARRRDGDSDGEPAVGINACFHTWDEAVAAEIGASGLIQAAGYRLDVMMSAYHATTAYEAECDATRNGDVLWDGKYFGSNLHPFDTLFIKTNRDIDPQGIDRLSAWIDGSAYSSWDKCAAVAAF